MGKNKPAHAEEEEPEDISKKSKKRKAALVDDTAELETDVELARKEKKLKKQKAREEAEEAAAQLEMDALLARKKEKKLKKEKARAEAAGEVEAECEEEPAEKVKKTKNKKEEQAEEVETSEKQQFTVFVGGIPWDTEESVVRGDFTECGEIARMTMPTTNEGKPSGMAFITFKSKEAVDAALKFDGTDYGDRTLEVRLAEKSQGFKKSVSTAEGVEQEDTPKHELTLFVSGIPWSCEEATLLKDFSECGKIVKMNMPMNDQGKPRGIAFITFEDKEGATAALKFDGAEYGSRTLFVKFADKNGGKGKGKESKGKGKGGGIEVFVAGLCFSTDEAILRKDFEECGEIVSLNMLRKPDGSCRGVAFIFYKTEDAVKKAVEFHNTDYGGRWITVERAGERNGVDKKGKGDKGKGK